MIDSAVRDIRFHANGSPRGSVWKRVVRRVLFAGDRRSGLSILLFHRVLSHADPFRSGDMTAVEFEAVMAYLAQTFTPLSLEEGIERLQSNSLPKAALAITFDDGYRDNLDIAAPILAAKGITATFFIATGFLDGSWMWNDRIIEACRSTSRKTASLVALELHSVDLGTERARIGAAHEIIDKAKHLPYDRRATVVAQLEDQLEVTPGRGPMLDPEDIRRLRNLDMMIGAHTVTHPILTRLDDTRARTEIHDSRDHLVEILREPVRMFAYPNGQPGRDYSSEHVTMVAEAGFSSALTTSALTARPGMDRYELPRFTPWDRTGRRFAARLAYARFSDAR